MNSVLTGSIISAFILLYLWFGEMGLSMIILIVKINGWMSVVRFG